VFNQNRQLENLIKKIIRIFKQDRELSEDCLGLEGLTTLGLANAAGNHYFDDYPEKFCITEREGQLIRGYFQSNKYDDKEVNDYIISLIRLK